MVKEKGISSAKTLLKGKIDAAHPIGYSASGVVTAIGQNVTGISVGDHVACAGAGYANHAELVDVPVNLVVKLSKEMSLSFASTVTLGAIALQGVRRTSPQLGEIMCVFGLGILGQITVQLLKNNGCRVIGIDLDQSRIDQALKNGLDIGINPKEQDVIDRIHKYTDNFGVDAVIISAAASNDDIIDQSMKMCRKKGRVVLVGSVSLNFSREDFYKKEIDFLISTSYGPGRYDARYEEEGQDYPYPYVRWTENRNMIEYLRLIEEGNINLADFIDDRFSVSEAPQAYADLKSGVLKSMLIVLKYPQESAGNTGSLVKMSNTKISLKEAIQVGLVGAGDFAQTTHLPNLKELSGTFELNSVMSRTGAKAVGVAKQFGAKSAVSDYKEILNNPDIDLVLISTRHNLHASMTLDALKNGKKRFCRETNGHESF